MPPTIDHARLFNRETVVRSTYGRTAADRSSGRRPAIGASAGLNIVFIATSLQTAKMLQKLVSWLIPTAGVATFSATVDYLKW